MNEEITQGTVLCVDDEDFVLESLVRTFRETDMRVLTATSGEEALEIMEKEPVEVVIADQRMPGMLGTELLSQVKDKWPQTIRIILSGYTEVPDLIRCINEGEVYRFISKPWNNKALVELVQKAVEQSRVIKEMFSMVDRLKQQGQEANQVNFDVEYLGNLIKMRLTETEHPLSAEQIIECLKKIFNLQKEGLELEAIGGALVRQNGKLSFMTEVGSNIQLQLEFPIKAQGRKDVG